MKDYRRIPSDVEITSNKKYVDSLYGYLQLKSRWDGENRIIDRNDINYSAIGKELCFSRQSIAKYISDFLEIGLLEDDYDKYILIEIPEDKTVAIESNLLEEICKCGRSVLTLYIYCKGSIKKPTMKALKGAIGASLKSRSNEVEIKERLSKLEELGLEVYNATKK